MNFSCQESAMLNLKNCAENDYHSILIEGVSGSGKTYLASQYMKMLDNVENFRSVKASVSDIRESIQDCYSMDTRILICVENLDQGVKAASYTLLKFLEEPRSDVYIVITCKDRSLVPDTIISRSVCISINTPTEDDIKQYGNYKDKPKFKEIQYTPLYKCIQTFSDVDLVLNMTNAQRLYFESLKEVSKFKESVSNIVWAIGHYDDGSETPVHLVLRYLLNLRKNDLVYQRKIIDCMLDLNKGNVGSHAVLSKLVFDCKYGD